MKYLIIVAMLFSGLAIAGGDKNQEQRPVVVDEDCIVIIPQEVDLEGCQQTSAPDQSGFVSWLCPYTLLCEGDDS